jgi:hypothetical protein
MDILTKHKRTRRHGTEAVEMAILLPLLMWLVMGAIEWGWIFLNLQEVTNAARQGARIEAMHGAALDAGEKEIKSLIPAGYLVGEPSVVPDTGNPKLITATVRVRVRHEGTDQGIAMINSPSLIPIPDEWQVVIKMAKEGA